MFHPTCTSPCEVVRYEVAQSPHTCNDAVQGVRLAPRHANVTVRCQVLIPGVDMHHENPVTSVCTSINLHRWLWSLLNLQLDKCDVVYLLICTFALDTV